MLAAGRAAGFGSSSRIAAIVVVEGAAISRSFLRARDRIAPMVFTGILEYPLILVLVCLLRNADEGQTFSRRWRIAAPILAAAVLAIILLSTANIQSLGLRLALMGLPTLFCLSVSRTRVSFAAAIGAMAGLAEGATLVGVLVGLLVVLGI